MVIKFLFLIFISLLTNHAFSASLDSLFTRKDYKNIVSRFHNRQTMKELTTKQLVKLSYSLTQMKMYRENTKVLYYIIKKDLYKDHLSVRMKIKGKETLAIGDYPKSLPIYYWQLYENFGHLLLSNKKINHKLREDKKIFDIFRQILSELEFRENRVEKLNDTVIEHIQSMEKEIYYFKWSLGLMYISWQHEANLHRKTSNSKTPMIITNSGYCLGGDVGIESGYYHFNINGCFLIGSGGISSYGNSNISYQQNIPAMGVKIGPEALFLVSSSRSRIGIGLPLIFTSQKYTQPSDTDYKVEDKTPFSYIATINSRWYFGDWYLRTEFGQYFKKQESFWAFGVGKQF